MTPTETFWNGEPAGARRVVVAVGKSAAPLAWSRGLEGQERYAVEVLWGNAPLGAFPFYLDDENGSGWHKVTTGHGSPAFGHRSLPVERVLRVLPDDTPCRCGE